MKYVPINIFVKHGKFTKKQLSKYYALLKFNPNKKRYECTLCPKSFLTETGGYNHIDYNHEDQIIKTKEG